MRKFSIILALILAMLGAAAQDRVEFSTLIHNLATIDENGGDVSCEFVLKNISKDAIVINKISTNCSCLTVRHSRKPILQDQADTLRVTFDPRFRTGEVNKNIFVYLSGESEPRKLVFRCNVLKIK